MRYTSRAKISDPHVLINQVGRFLVLLLAACIASFANVSASAVVDLDRCRNKFRKPRRVKYFSRKLLFPSFSSFSFSSAFAIAAASSFSIIFLRLNFDSANKRSTNSSPSASDSFTGE